MSSVSEIRPTVLDGRSLVVVSNRGPIEFSRGPDGRAARRGAGGLVTGLSGLCLDDETAVWVCCPASDEDGVVADEHGGGAFTAQVAGRRQRLRFVPQPEAEYHRYYREFSNPLLWFLQHSMWDLAFAPGFGEDEWSAYAEGYVPVNRRIADAVVDEVSGDGSQHVVLLHDYHLYLVAEEVRRRRPAVLLQHFVHIPWPSPQVWRSLPRAMGEEILHGLLGNDIVAFHTERYARRFLDTCDEVLGLAVDRDQPTVWVQGRPVRVQWYPISIDAVRTVELADAPEVVALADELRASATGSLLVRVDRADPSKNVVRGFAAFELLLRRHPEHLGAVTFLALIQPTRGEIPEYRDYLAQVRQAADEVNARHGTATWTPVDLRVVEDLTLAFAAYRAYDVLLVNPVNDGLNLVAKEGVLANAHDGVLVLSENAGVHDEIGAFALSVNPFDLRGQADALHEALVMSGLERADRLRACREVIVRNDLSRWFSVQLADLQELDQATSLLPFGSLHG